GGGGGGRGGMYTGGRCPCHRPRHVPAKRPGPSGHGGSGTPLAVPQIRDVGGSLIGSRPLARQQAGLRIHAAGFRRAREPRSDPPWAHNDPSGRLASPTSLAPSPTLSAGTFAFLPIKPGFQLLFHSRTADPPK